jgi:hypothetical protein
MKRLSTPVFAAIVATLIGLCLTLSIAGAAVQGHGSVPSSVTIATTAPLTGGGDLSANRTLAISAASGSAAGSMSAADFTKLSVVTHDTARLGIGVTPTHTLTLAAGGTGLAINNVDGASNQFLSIVPVSDVFTISTGGAGTARNILVRGGTAGGSTTYSASGSMSYGATTTGATSHAFTATTHTSTSLVQSDVSIASTCNQTSGTGGCNGLLINSTQTACSGSAGCNTIEGQKGATRTWKVTTDGAPSFVSNTAPPASGAATSCILVSSTAGLGFCWGSGAPTFSAAQGTLYMNVTGSSSSTRAYVNSSGSTTWVAVTTGS